MKEFNIVQSNQQSKPKPEEGHQMISISIFLLESMEETAREMIGTARDMQELRGRRGFFVLRKKDDRFIHLHKMEMDGQTFFLGQIKLDAEI